MGESITQRTEPWSPQQSYLKDIYKKAQRNYNDGTQYYPDQTYLELNDLQKGSLQDKLDYGTNTMPQMFDQTYNTLGQMYNAPDVANNPYISGVADVMTDRLNRNMTENVMPGIQGNFNQVGQYGGGRQDVMRQQAGRDTQEALSQGLAGLYSDAYGQGLGQQAKGMAVAPQVAQMGLMGSGIQGQVGDTLQSESYKPLQEDIARWNFEQQAPWSDLSQYTANVQGNVGSSLTGESSNSGSTLSNMVGGGLLGAGLGDFANKQFKTDIPSWVSGGLGAIGGLLWK